MQEDIHARRRLGKIFKSLRKVRGFTQQDFAKHAQIDRSYYAKIEKGTVDISMTIFRRIAKGLDYRLSRLARVVERNYS